ncbi:T9SS type A sorting domain-containing protein [Dyadobacter flavalbus]|uniref:T9SS type A sorting domain-containing protein n=1 Tax=Dyadobacter flavalbus TaxID=2579942 RepID=A0A5M8QTJ7_9BACT|nr:T9SS type A sorting domain-containing protein [Dyadobacter flavalbus]KAA6438601.1 T9SS type A sorting domain-containing protein [Dyadobacter flavalbus]
MNRILLPQHIFKFLLALLVFVQASVFAQPKIEWEKIYGGTGGDVPNSIKQTADGGFIISGTTTLSGDKNQVGYGSSDIWIIKLAADGSKQWDKILGGEGTEQNTFIELTPDGGYIVGTSSNSGVGPIKSEPAYGIYPEDKLDYWIIKLSASGAVEWDKTIGGPDIDLLTSVKPTKDGGYILAGSSESEIGNNKTKAPLDKGYTDHWIVKLSASRTVQWDVVLGRRQDGMHYRNEGAIVELTSDGGYLIGGSQGPNPLYEYVEDFYLARLSQNGAVQWEKTIAGAGDNILKSIQQLNDGSFLLGGEAITTTLDDQGEYICASCQDFWIVRIDAQGNKLWDKTIGSGYDAQGYNLNFLTSAVKTSDGGYLLGGSSRSSAGRDKSEPSRGGRRDVWVVKLDSNRTKVWDRTIGGSQTDRLQSLAPTKDGGVILASFSDSPVSGEKSENSRGYEDYWIVKLAPEPLPVTLTSFTAQKENTTALLTWSTSSETRNDRFEVQRSFNGKTWDLIATVKSNGDVNKPANYMLVDNKPVHGVDNLYRLKMIDIDGSFTYSKIQSLHFDSDVALNIFPNPASDVLNIEMADWHKVKTVELLNSRSDIVYISGKKPVQSVFVKDFSTGIYFVRVTLADGSSSVKKVLIGK